MRKLLIGILILLVACGSAAAQSLRWLAHLPFLLPFARRITGWLPAFLVERLYQLLHYPLEMSIEPYFEVAFQSVSDTGLEGDYLEFGVYEGISFSLAYQLAGKFKMDKMRFFAFDSFHGLPSSELSFQPQDYSASRELFTKNIRKVGVDMRRVKIIEGFYDDSLTPEVLDRNELSKAAVVHVDCDLYISAKEVLRFIEPLLQVGTVLIFDDWNIFRNEVEDVDNFGERRAFLEWPFHSCFDELYEHMRFKAFIMKSLAGLSNTAKTKLS